MLRSLTINDLSDFNQACSGNGLQYDKWHFNLSFGFRADDIVNAICARVRNNALNTSLPTLIFQNMGIRSVNTNRFWAPEAVSQQIQQVNFNKTHEILLSELNLTFQVLSRAGAKRSLLELRENEAPVNDTPEGEALTERFKRMRTTLE